MSTKKQLIFILSLSITIASLWFFIWKSPVKVRIGYLPISSHLPIYIAKKEDYFATENVEVELIEYKDSSSLVAAVLVDNIDLAYECATDVALNAMVRDKDAFKIYQIAISKGTEPLNSFLVPTGSSSKNLDEIFNSTIQSDKKLRIGVFPGPTARAFVETIIKEAIPPNKQLDTEIVSVPPGIPQIEILTNKRVDILFTYEPFVSMIESNNAGVELLPGPVEKYLIDPWPGGIGIISTRFINESPESSRSVINAIYKAFDFTKNNDTMARKYLTEFSNLPDNIANNVRLTSHIKLNTDFDHVLLGRYVERLVDWEILQERVNLDEAYISRE